MLNFINIKWANSKYRGMGFGFSGNTYVNLPYRTVTIEVLTGSTTENDIRFREGASVVQGWTTVDMEFTDDPVPFSGKGEQFSYASMYISKDGKDPLEGTSNPPRPARENAALKPNSTYYLHMAIPDGINGELIRLSYFATDSADFGGNEPIAIMPIEMSIEGIDGVWYPNS